jgi:hypothetical protein
MSDMTLKKKVLPLLMQIQHNIASAVRLTIRIIIKVYMVKQFSLTQDSSAVQYNL